MAFRYIQDVKESSDEAAAENVDLKALRRKIDWHILPVMFLCYTMQIPRQSQHQRKRHIKDTHEAKQLTSVQYAAVMGINADLKLQGNDFSNASTAFFIAYPANKTSILTKNDQATSSRGPPPANGSASTSPSGATPPPAPPPPTTTPRSS
jgi:hypothetical protein